MRETAIIDAHNHLAEDYDPDAAAGHLEGLSSLGVKSVMVCALGHDTRVDNNAVLDLKNRYPEQIVPFGYVDLDGDEVGAVSELRDRGFSGLKVTRTRRGYDDDAYMAHYEQAAEARMPVLFHTGFLGLEYAKDARSDDYRPIRLDRIARRFPELGLICAHMGNPWWEEAFLVMWKHKSVYCDLSGLSAIRRDRDLWVKLFKPNGELHEACDKLIFAGDQFLFGSVPYSTEYLDFYGDLFDRLDLGTETRRNIMYRNFEALVLKF